MNLNESKVESFKNIKVWINKHPICTVIILLFVFVFFVSMASSPTVNSDISSNSNISETSKVKPKDQTQNTNSNSISKTDAEKQLAEIISLGKKAGLITSYEFSNTANVIYIGSVWYTQTVSFKKDLMAKISILKEVATGYRHYEVRDAYSNEKVAEVTAFSGSLEVYK